MIVSITCKIVCACAVYALTWRPLTPSLCTTLALLLNHVLDAVDILCQASGKAEGSQEKAIGAYKRLENIPWRLGEPVVSEALGYSRGPAADRAFCHYK